MAVEYNFILDMDRSKRDNNIAYARTGDIDSITIKASLVLNGAAYTPTGDNAFFECITPNGRSIRSAAVKSGSTVSVDVPSAAFQAAGVINVAYFKFESGEADNPTYVESTEPFAIVVREGIGDNIDAGDYIEEWRALADELEAIVSEVEQKAIQAEAAINEQKAEVDQLKAQAQTSIAQDTEDVSDAKDTALSNINSSQGAVDAAIDQLEEKTKEAVDAAQAALDGTLAADIEAEVGRTLKLDVADMVEISSNVNLSSLTTVGSYCCKTAAVAATISDSPVDDSPFNMYVFSSSTAGQVMQLVVPIDLNSKPTAEWHVRFGTSSAMDPWSVIGGGADISAGLGIDVTGDAQKTVALDTTAFYQHHEAASIIQGSTEVTGGGRIKELVVYGNTRQNMWVNPSGTSNGVTVKANADGSVTLSGTATAELWIIAKKQYSIRPSTKYTLSASGVVSGGTARAGFYVSEVASDGTETAHTINNGETKATFTTKADCVSMICGFIARSGDAVSGTYSVMLNEGSEPEPWCPPGLNGVDELSVVCAGKNLLPPVSDWNASGNYVRYIKNTLTIGTQLIGQYGGNPDGLSGNVRLEFREDYDSDSYSMPITPWSVASVAGNAVTVTEHDRYICLITVENAAAYFDAMQVQLELGDTATAYEPPAVTSTPVDLDGHALNSLPDGTCDELRIGPDGRAVITKRVGSVEIPGDASGMSWEASGGRAYFDLPSATSSGGADQSGTILCDVLPPRKGNEETYIIANGSDGQAYIKIAGTASTAEVAGKVGGGTLLYPLAEPVEVELPDVVMPDLASPSYTVYASSNVPAEIEAEVVKVDYLPASDVYTKEEVDQKIEAGSMPDIVPVSQGGTGVTTAAAERNRLGLGNMTGALPVANGGTGATTANGAMYNVTSGMAEETSSVSDDTFLIYAYDTPSSGNGGIYKRKLQKVWDYIDSKVRSTFGFDSSNVLPVANGGTGASGKGVDLLSNIGITFGTADPPSTGTPGTIYIQTFE